MATIIGTFEDESLIGMAFDGRGSSVSRKGMMRRVPWLPSR
jgi:hypothetical protein